MKLVIIILSLLFSLTTAQASWFGDKEQDQKIQQYEQQLSQERNNKNTWQVASGVFALGAVVLFTVGTALGSTTRRHGKAK